MKIAISGAAGQLGGELCRQLGAYCVPLDRAALDITDEAMVRRVVHEIRPDALINCAAYTQVDRAEQEPQRCAAVNAIGVAHLAQACDDARCVLVHISTDYVFGGDTTRRTPYRETDPPKPQSVYARTKLDGEKYAVRCARHIVVRTCGLYGGAPESKNFVDTMLRLGRQRSKVRVVDDQECTPTHVRDVAKAVRFLLDTGTFGVYHVVNEGATTWYGFAREIFRGAGMDVAVEPITTAEYGAAAERPRYSVLDCTKFKSMGGPQLPGWQQALATHLASRS